MTFSLRRKRPTTPPCGQVIPTARAISLAAVWLLLAGSLSAQQVKSAVHWQPTGRMREVPPPAQTVQQTTFQAQDEALVQAQPEGDTAQYPPKRPPARIGDSPLAPRHQFAAEEADFTIRIELPGLDRLTRRESELQMFERVRQEARLYPGSPRIYFPEEDPTPREDFTPRTFPLMVQTVEPHYVNHRRLFFEQPNTERHGWDFGPFSPAVNVGVFYYDVALFPYHYWSRKCRNFETSAGKCLPGDPTPLLLYREEFSVTGLVGQTATILGGFFAFP